MESRSQAMSAAYLSGLTAASDGKAVQAGRRRFEAEQRQIELGIRTIRRDSRLEVALDDTFAKYWDQYGKRKEDALFSKQVLKLPGGKELRQIDLLTEELRGFLLKSYRRRHGLER